MLCTQTDAAWVERALVSRHGVLVACDAAQLKHALGRGAGQAHVAEVHQC